MNTTLCYLERNGKYLMLHRTKKEGDLNKDKWIGVGGKLESGESPEDCLYREVFEETGYTLKDHRFRGIVTFVYGEITEYMYLYTSSDFDEVPESLSCDEGDLLWIDIDEVGDLNLWEGDRVFLDMLRNGEPPFLLTLKYDADILLSHSALPI